MDQKKKKELIQNKLRKIKRTNGELKKKVEAIDKNRDKFEIFFYASFNWITNAGLGILAFFLGFLIQLKLSENSIPILDSILIGLPLVFSVGVGIYFKFKIISSGVKRTNYQIHKVEDLDQTQEKTETQKELEKLENSTKRLEVLLPYVPNIFLVYVHVGTCFFALFSFAIFLLKFLYF